MSKVSSAKTKGHLTKKELKQDNLVKLAYEAEHFYLKHQKWVIGAVVGVLVIVFAVIVVRKTMESSKLEASYQLTMAKMNYGANKLEDARTAFLRIAANEGGATAGEAKYFLARINFDQGKFQQAADDFKLYLKDYRVDDELDCAAMAGLAASYEALDKQEEAAKLYNEIADKYPNVQFAPQALWEASRIYLKLNQNDVALKSLERIKAKYAESAVMGQAKKVLESLE
jgi:TolA-binding protein